MIRQREVPYEGHLHSPESLKIHPQKVKAIHEMPEPKTKKRCETAPWLCTVSEQLSA